MRCGKKANRLVRQPVPEVNKPIHLPQSSSASRLTAGACGFLNLSQSGDLPERLRDPSRLETMPFAAELAGMLEDRQPAVVRQVLVEAQPVAALPQDAGQHRFAHFDGFSA